MVVCFRLFEKVLVLTSHAKTPILKKKETPPLWWATFVSASKKGR